MSDPYVVAGHIRPCVGGRRQADGDRACYRTRRQADGSTETHPNRATHGLLCDGCHTVLWDTLTGIERQVAALRADVAPSLAHPPDSDHRSGGEVWQEAVRLSCLDMAQHLEDSLSELLESVAEDYRISPPQRLITLSEGHAWDTTDREPPARWSLATASKWLRDNILRVESRATVGDEMEHLSELMSRAHALSPWRWPSEPLRGIPCPSCHRMRVRFYPHGETLSSDPDKRAGVAKCLACNDTWLWARWLIWARMYEADSDTKWTTETRGQA